MDCTVTGAPPPTATSPTWLCRVTRRSVFHSETSIRSRRYRLASAATGRLADSRSMSHRSHLCTIVIDVPAADHAATAAFWGAATGAEQQQLPHPEFHGARLHPSLVLLVQRLGEGGPRVHVDIHTEDRKST